MPGFTLNNLDILTEKIITAKQHKARFMVAIIGAPGSGKSTLAQALRARLTNEYQCNCAIVAMDGFHLDNTTLAKRGLLAVKGSPQTFDVMALQALLKSLRAHQTRVMVPSFDRDLDAVIAESSCIEMKTNIILVEGNYLLLKERGWDNLSQYFDMSAQLKVPRDELQKRLRERWITQGFDWEGATAKVDSNDLPNADLVENHSKPADLELTS
ncbi:MAG: AAA family ATPase [Oceanospirillaceae bacterium]|nr:AAA family ATPase [Oceanospirillaceae bacterium]